MNAMVTNPSSDFSRVYKELLNSLQRQQQQLQNSLFQSGLPYLDPALFLQSLSRVSSTFFALKKWKYVAARFNTSIKKA